VALELQIGDEDSIEKFSKRTVKVMMVLSDEIGNKEFVQRVSLNLYQIYQLLFSYEYGVWIFFQENGLSFLNSLRIVDKNFIKLWSFSEDVL
jgi:hypothetical protein